MRNLEAKTQIYDVGLLGKKGWERKAESEKSIVRKLRRKRGEINPKWLKG